MSDSDSNINKSEYNAMRLLMHFQRKFQETYGTPYQINPGRDLAILKKMKNLFDEAEQLPHIYAFIDLCLQKSKDKQISTPYLLAATNSKFGLVKGKKRTEEVVEKPTADMKKWLDAEQEKWNNKLG